MEHPKQGQGLTPRSFFMGARGTSQANPHFSHGWGMDGGRNRGLRVDGLLEAPDAVCKVESSVGPWIPEEVLVPEAVSWGSGEPVGYRIYAPSCSHPEPTCLRLPGGRTPAMGPAGRRWPVQYHVLPRGGAMRIRIKRPREDQFFHSGMF